MHLQHLQTAWGRSYPRVRFRDVRLVRRTRAFSRQSNVGAAIVCLA
jgi:hypothetical protein